MQKKNLKKIFSCIIFCGYLTVLSSASAQEVQEEAKNSENLSNTKENVQETSSLPSYTWADFLTNKDCRPLIKELANKPEYNKLYQNLRVSCLGEKLSAWDSLLNTFRREKRKLLLNQTMQSTSYTKYFKVIPYLLFDIQNTTPIGNQPVSVLDKIEKAILDHQIDTTLSLINELPDPWKNGLNNTQVVSKRMLELEKQLNELNNSEKGDQND